jgi:hypothetical protein
MAGAGPPPTTFMATTAKSLVTTSAAMTRHAMPIPQPKPPPPPTVMAVKAPATPLVMPVKGPSPTPLVMPAKAGIHVFLPTRNSRESNDQNHPVGIQSKSSCSVPQNPL